MKKDDMKKEIIKANFDDQTKYSKEWDVCVNIFPVGSVLESIDKGIIKIGDGINTFNDLPVFKSNCNFPQLNLKESFDYLGISDHYERAFNSSSTGELFFLQDYITLANYLRDNDFKELNEFTKWFNEVVDEAYKTWERPISIYQHILNPENFK